MAEVFDSRTWRVWATRVCESAWRRASFSGLGGIGGAGAGVKSLLWDGSVTSSGEVRRSMGGCGVRTTACC